MGGEVIEILDNEEEEAINQFVQQEILMKLEPDQEDAVLQDAVKTVKGDEPRRLARARIVNRQYKDYELYVTVEEEEIILATVVGHLDMYHTKVLLYHTMVLLARPTKVRR